MITSQNIPPFSALDVSNTLGTYAYAYAAQNGGAIGVTQSNILQSIADQVEAVTNLINSSKYVSQTDVDKLIEDLNNQERILEFITCPTAGENQGCITNYSPQ